MNCALEFHVQLDTPTEEHLQGALQPAHAHVQTHIDANLLLETFGLHFPDAYYLPQ